MFITICTLFTLNIDGNYSHEDYPVQFILIAGHQLLTTSNSDVLDFTIKVIEGNKIKIMNVSTIKSPLTLHPLLSQ